MDLLFGSPKSNNGESHKLTVESVDNHIYFYSYVDEDRALALIKELREIDSRLRNEAISRNLDFPIPIWLHIQSPGGNLFAGFSIADQVKTLKSPIYSVIEGYCASAATLFSISCSKRFITSSSFMLIHQLSDIIWGGKYEELKDQMKMLSMATEKIIDFYKNHTKMNEDEIKKLLQRESWFDANECIERGLVDEVYK